MAVVADDLENNLFLKVERKWPVFCAILRLPFNSAPIMYVWIECAGALPHGANRSMRTASRDTEMRK